MCREVCGPSDYLEEHKEKEEKIEAGEGKRNGSIQPLNCFMLNRVTLVVVVSILFHIKKNTLMIGHSLHSV